MFTKSNKLFFVTYEGKGKNFKITNIDSDFMNHILVLKYFFFNLFHMVVILKYVYIAF